MKKEERSLKERYPKLYALAQTGDVYAKKIYEIIITQGLKENVVEGVVSFLVGHNKEPVDEKAEDAITKK